MEGHHRTATLCVVGLPALLVIVAGAYADNIMVKAVPASLSTNVVAAMCGLVIGSLAVLTFTRHPFAFSAVTALFSALGVVALTLTLPREQECALLGLCALTVAACVIAPRFASSAQEARPVPAPIEVHDDHRQ